MQSAGNALQRQLTAYYSQLGALDNLHAKLPSASAKVQTKLPIDQRVILSTRFKSRPMVPYLVEFEGEVLPFSEGRVSYF